MDNTAKQRADRIAALRAELGKQELDTLKKGAVDLKLGLDGTETKDELEFAIAEATVNAEDAAAAKAAEDEAAAKAKAEREAFYGTKAGKAQRAKDEAAARDDAVRRVHHRFIGALPQRARMQGVHEVAPDSVEAGEHPVPDGSYRVLGSDWVLHFKGGKWAGANQAHARGKPDWIEIPDAPGNPVGAPAKATANDNG